MIGRIFLCLPLGRRQVVIRGRALALEFAHGCWGKMSRAIGTASRPCQTGGVAGSHIPHSENNNKNEGMDERSLWQIILDLPVHTCTCKVYSSYVASIGIPTVHVKGRERCLGAGILASSSNRRRQKVRLWLAEKTFCSLRVP